MTPEQIGIELTAITTLLIDKTGEQPFAGMPVKIGGSGRVTLDLRRGYNEGKYDLGTATADTFEDLFVRARAIIASIPSEKESNLRDFHKGVADLIDKGHANGIPDEYVNPLRKSHEAMSENLLTYQEAAE